MPSGATVTNEALLSTSAPPQDKQFPNPSIPRIPQAPRVLTQYQHVYLHVPFCGRRCSYCDFAIAVRKVVPVSEFVDAIMAELVTRGETLAREPGTDLRSIYLGGGTPSKLGGAGIATLLRRIAHQAGVEIARVDKPSGAEDPARVAARPVGGSLGATTGGTRDSQIEVTIEANPEDVTPDAVAEWAVAGVSRVSMGVQSFDPNVLRWMHREHPPEQAARAVKLLRDGGIGDVSVDLIFAVPEVLNRDWDRDLEEALNLQPNHVSLYGLTVEPHTPLGRWTARGQVQEAPEERYEREFLRAHERLTAAGFEHYEVSNYGRPGHRARHNSAYWQGVPYLGLGPSAHGFDGRVRRWNRRNYTDWLAEVTAGRDPIEGSEELTPAERSAEAVYLGLRTTDGLDLGVVADANRQKANKMVSEWIASGWGALQSERLVLSPAGWLRLDSIAASVAAVA